MFATIRGRRVRGLLKRAIEAGMLLILFLLLSPGPAAARHGDPPRSFDRNLSKSLRAVTSIDLRVLPDVDEARFLKEDTEREASGEAAPLRFAAPVDAGFDCAVDGTWEELPGGARVWRHRVVSAGARSLNLLLDGVRLPEGAELHVYPAGSANRAAEPAEASEYQGPFTAADVNAEGELWTPIVSGDDAILELYVPAGAAFDPQLTVRRVNHDYRGFASLHAPEKDQGSCNVDVICSQGDPWRKEIRAVAVYTLSGNWTCTGTLVNSHDAQRPPLFLTANHCTITQQNAGSMVVYWNYESPSCGMLAGGSLTDNQSGASLLAKWADSDFCLVRLNQPPAAGSHVYYAGWDAREETAPPWAVCIHHPDCKEKAISFTNRPLSVTSYLANPSPGNGTHWRIIQWDEGTTEPGSSGSGLWDPDHRLVGQLHGGRASCSATTESDWYGRMARSWDGGGANESRLSHWLDPQNSGVKFLDGYDPFGGGALAGDANVDGGVNVLDLVAIVNDILGIQALSTQGRTNADLDANGRLSILDLVRVVNIILNPGEPLAGGSHGGVRYEDGVGTDDGGRDDEVFGAVMRRTSPSIEVVGRLEGQGSDRSLVLTGDLSGAAAFEMTLQTEHRSNSGSPRLLNVRIEDAEGWVGAASLLPDGRLRVVCYAVRVSVEGGSRLPRVSIVLPPDAGRLAWNDGAGADARGEAMVLRAAGFPLEPAASVSWRDGVTVQPNPTRHDWEMEMSLPGSGEIAIELFDASGRLVASQARRDVREGPNRLRWSAGGVDATRGPAPGLYFVRVRQGERVIGERKVLVIR
jgi:hypothetical protein